MYYVSFPKNLFASLSFNTPLLCSFLTERSWISYTTLRSRAVFGIRCQQHQPWPTSTKDRGIRSTTTTRSVFVWSGWRRSGLAFSGPPFGTSIFWIIRARSQRRMIGKQCGTLFPSSDEKHKKLLVLILYTSPILQNANILKKIKMVIELRDMIPSSVICVWFFCCMLCPPWIKQTNKYFIFINAW